MPINIQMWVTGFMVQVAATLTESTGAQLDSFTAQKRSEVKLARSESPSRNWKCCRLFQCAPNKKHKHEVKGQTDNMATEKLPLQGTS